MNGPCISCGFPLEEAKKHHADNPGKDYCTYCAAEDGSLKSYAQVVEGYTQFLMHQEQLEREAAVVVARERVSGQPAWKDAPEARA